MKAPTFFNYLKTMKNQLFVLFLCLIQNFNLSAQITFNSRQTTLGMFASVITNIELGDSCFYICGVGVDTNRISGSFFSKLDLEGNVVKFKNLNNDTLSFQLSTETLNKKNKKFYVAGVGNNGNGFQTIFIKLNENGEIEHFNWIEKSSYPIKTPIPQYMVPIDNDWIIIEQFTNTSRNRHEGRITRLDSTGNKIWEKIYADPEYSFRPKTILVDSQSIVIGGGKGNVDYRLNNYHEQTVILSYNHQGEFEWKFESQQGWSSAESIIPTSDSGYIIGAKRGISVKVNLTVDVFQFEHLIFKIDKDQNLEWYRLMRDHHIHEFNNLEKLIDVGDGVVYCGHLITEVTGFQGILGKVSYDGDSLWMKSYIFESDSVFTYNHMLFDLEKTKDKGLISVGLLHDDTPPQNQYGWILKTDEFGCLIPGCQISNIEETSSKFEIDLSIYPNPTSDYLNFMVKGQEDKKLNYRVITSEGKVFFKNEILKANTTYIIPVNSWPVGTYFLQILEGNSAIGSKQFVKVD
jgi:hypothetical protein